jgi:molecular chaperone GrpE (heat shock protein)
VSDSQSAEIARLREEVSAMRSEVHERLAEDPVRQQAFDKLYAELKAYRDDFLAEAEKPLLLDLLLLYDSFNWFHQRIISEKMSQEVVADSFQFLVDELLEVLYRRDVTPQPDNDTFDRTLQRAIRIETTSKKSENNKIAKVLKRGFQRKGKPLRAEEVVVYKFKGKPDHRGE